MVVNPVWPMYIKKKGIADLLIDLEKSLEILTLFCAAFVHVYGYNSAFEII